MQMPEILKPYLEAGKELFLQGLVGEVEFSHGTYQVQVFDHEKNESWGFLQLDEKNHLKDCFCSCSESEDTSSCPHLVAAYLKIFNGKDTPLHVRFEKSLWNLLCRLYSERMGNEETHLTKIDSDEYAILSVGGKKLFYIKAKSNSFSNKLSEILFKRDQETEETSLKFSNLSQEEIMLWRTGNPTEDLKYELSFWYDLAKWFKLLQDAKTPYEIEFAYSKKEIPNEIHVKFKDLEFGFYLSLANLPIIIPSLSTVKSPLKVYEEFSEKGLKITYDKVRSQFNIHAKHPKESFKKNLIHPEGVQIDDWIFVKDKGFYPLKQEGIFTFSEITEEKIPEVLNEHFRKIQTFLEGTYFHEEPVEPSYAISFDDEWNLHLSSYLFREGDLTENYSKDFGKFAYINDDGFYRLVNRSFDFVEKVVLRDEVADFVRQNRLFFNNQEGFKLHVASVEAELVYELNEENKLTFQRRALVKNDDVETHDFGPFVYVAGEGFYTKVSHQIGLPVRADIAIHKNQIPLFIRMNRKDLEHVPNFFSENCPVLKSGLNIHLNENKIIEITPQYTLKEGYENQEIRYFDDFCFVKGEGFHELPGDSRIPDEYRYPVDIHKERQSLFLNYELPKLIAYTIKIDSELIFPKFMKLKALEISKVEDIQGGFYSLKLAIQTDRGFILANDIWSGIKKKDPYLFHKNGLLDLKDKYFDWLRVLDKSRVNHELQLITLSTLELIRLHAFYQIEVEDKNSHSLALLEELTEIKLKSEPDFSNLNSELRAYQKIGVNWFWFLYQHGLSGILADDMGLGKTHQTMALLASLMKIYEDYPKTEKKRFLVICPTSVIYHWQEKLESFLPNAKVFTFHGSYRHLEDFYPDHDVLLTSYGIWRIEHEALSKIPFEVAIFDEIQIAKNHHSRIYSTLLNVQSKMRIGLTGTPIENHLRELKALFDLVLPSYMPNDADFRDFFVKPIEKGQSRERKELLTRFIKPFLLRRKKSQVLLDLPEKIEEVAHAELSEIQQMLYIETWQKSKSLILDDLKNQSKAIPYMHIFATIAALKQICDHPAVFYKTPSEYLKYSSGKWDLFVELLNEARESEQKVVVFSQYLSMLDIFEEYLNENSIGFATIRGSTLNRGEQIHRFKVDPECEVFIGSLQAAGLGLDLTAASVVIHYDRWWNAARENQATDRVHRIGQTRGVQVFKLVTKNTIEEKIDEMIFKKGRLMEDIITVDDHEMIKRLNRDELIELLQFIPNPNF